MFLAKIVLFIQGKILNFQQNSNRSISLNQGMPLHDDISVESTLST